jgi:GABA(A) receptor-associated protein
MENSTFKIQYDYSNRHSEAMRIRSKYPDRVPVIIQTIDKHINLDKYKYLVPSDLTMGQLMYVIRKRIKLRSEQALFLFVNNTIQAGNCLIGDIYELNGDKDGFLYIYISSENTFG